MKTLRASIKQEERDARNTSTMDDGRGGCQDPQLLIVVVTHRVASTLHPAPPLPRARSIGSAATSAF